MTPDDIAALEKNITTIPYAHCGTWANPLGGTPSFTAQLVSLNKDTGAQLPGVAGELTIPFLPGTLIDPADIGVELPAITHEQFHTYFKTLVLAAMVANDKAEKAALAAVDP